MRVPGTTTSLVSSKYGPPIYHETFLNLIAKAQYEIIQEVVTAHGDGPVSQPNFEWSQGKLYIRISRPLARQDLTWLMLGDTLEGMREFFDGLRGWFETSITVLDDLAGPVASGSLRYWWWFMKDKRGRLTLKGHACRCKIRKSQVLSFGDANHSRIHFRTHSPLIASMPRIASLSFRVSEISSWLVETPSDATRSS